MPTPINILKNGQSILKWFESATISMTESGYCYSLDLILNSLELWDQFDPDLNNDDLAIKVLIGGQTYEFLCEERSVSSNIEGETFSVWGRTKQAYLDKPFSRTIKDTDETDHPWQTQDVLVQEIISYILSNYCDYSVTVDWNVENFLVYKDSFSVSERTPIEVISGLADVIGAKLIAHPDGTLSIETYSVTEETAVKTYNDFDHITALSEETKYSLGYNAVTIVGRGASTNSAQLQYEVQGEGNWVAGEERIVRVYYFHPSLLPIHTTLGNVSCRALSSGTETITEDVLLTFGSGSYSKFDLEGESNVSGTITTPLELRSVSYQVKYKDFGVIENLVEEEEGYILFYFEDKSASSLLTLSSSSTSGSDDLCSALSIETEILEDDDTKFKLKIYGNPSYVTEIKDIFGDTIPVPGITGTEKVTEILVFSDGESSLSKPFYENLLVEPLGLTVGIESEEPFIVEQYKNGITTAAELEDLNFAAIVSYYTSYGEEELPIHSTCLSDPEKYTEYILFITNKCEEVSNVSITVPEEDDGTATQEEECSNVSIEMSSDRLFRIYGNPALISNMYKANEDDLATGMTNVPIPGTARVIEYVEEILTFTNGESSLSKPLYRNYTILNSTVGISTVETKRYTNSISINVKDPVIVYIRYETAYVEGSIFAGSETIVAGAYQIFAETECDGLLSMSTTVVEEEEEESEVTYQDVTITVKDYATDVIVSSAQVYVDGGYVGTTDSNGELFISQLAVGDHTLRITATNYQNSEDDELSNDTFTVSA